jgi:hypothetical protein
MGSTIDIAMSIVDVEVNPMGSFSTLPPKIIFFSLYCGRHYHIYMITVTDGYYRSVYAITNIRLHNQFITGGV